MRHSFRSRLLCTCVAAALALVCRGLAADVPSEARLKAAFVYRFAQFVEWPDHALARRDAVDVCVLEPNPFEDVLHTLVEGESIGRLPLRVRAVSTPASASACHVLFLPEQSAAREATLRAVASLPVLTVSDAPRFLESGGIIQVGVAGGNMRFAVNLDAARASRLRLSAQLLRLAISVRGGGQ